VNEDVNNLVPPDADHFINTLRRYHAFYKTCDYRLLIVKENQGWLVLGGIIISSSQHKNPSVRRPFVQGDRLLVIHKVQEFHLNSLINLIKELCKGRITLENKEISQSVHGPPCLKTQEKTQWNMYGLKAPEPWPANLLIFTGTNVKEMAPDLTELRDLIRIHKPAAFSELHQLSEKLVAFPIYPSDASRMYIIAPFYKKLEKIKLTSEGRLTFYFVYHESLKSNDFRATVFYFSGENEIDNFHISFQTPPVLNGVIKSQKTDIIRRVTNVTNGTLILVYKKKTIQTYHFEAEGRVIIPHVHVTRGLEHLQINQNQSQVFIIHGHDMMAPLQLEKMIKKRWHLNPIILRDQPAKGRTLIEKFEQEAISVAYAFAIFTPDDIVSTEAGEYLQARPNVIFELGWFYRKLGRDKVCMLFKRGTKIHSDLEGIERLEFNGSIEEIAVKIEDELRSAKLI
jgi:predicted nucleotide-binding protein